MQNTEIPTTVVQLPIYIVVVVDSEEIKISVFDSLDMRLVIA